MRLFLLLLTITGFSALNAQTFQWGEPTNYQQSNTSVRTVNNALSDRQVETGMALYYADYLHGQATAMGEIYNRNLMTGAHKTLPFGSIVKITRTDNGKSVVVRINDRGPYCDGCLIDVSNAAAAELDLLRVGKTQVVLQVIGMSNENPQRPLRNTDLVARGGNNNLNNGNLPANAYNSTYPTTNNQQQARGVQPNSYDQQNQGRIMGTTPKAVAVNVEKSPEEVQILTNAINGFAVQLGSYGEFSNAERHVVALQRKGFDQIFVLQETSDAGTSLSRVIVAPFLSITEAQNYLGDLREYYQMEGIVVKIQ